MDLKHLRVLMRGLGREDPAFLSYLVTSISGTRRSLDIENSGFDRPFYLQSGVKELKMANHWLGRWVHGPDSGEGYLVRPEFYPKGIGPVWNPEEEVCQGVQSTWSTHRAAVVQRVNLPLGATSIRVEAEAAYYAPGGGMAVTVGLDGTGQVNDFEAGTIHWSGHWLDQDGGWPPDTWGVVATELEQAETGQVSIWLRSQNRWRARNCHVYWRQVMGSCLATTPSPEPGPEPPGEDASLEELIEYLYDLLDLQHATLGHMLESLEAVRPEVIHEEHYKRMRGEADG